MSKTPDIRIRGASRASIPPGFIIGRLKGTGPPQLLNLQALRGLGVATQRDVQIVASAPTTTAMGVSIDGGGAAIPLGLVTASLYIPVPCTIIGNTMLADRVGSIVIDVWRDNYANYPPTIADPIAGAALPTITASNKSQDVTLTGWSTACAAGDILSFSVVSCVDIQHVDLQFQITVP